jgi:8-oxo-dGTP pyrophosphatase MutT (NUDIX family)
MLKEVVRHKVFVIPHYKDKVMMVQDKGTKEWGFISGGVKRHEERNPLLAAERELREETSGLMSYIPNNYGRGTFTTKYRTSEHLENNKKKGQTVTSRYTVFWIEISPSFIENTLHTKFVPNNEIIALRVAPYGTFSNRWEVCDEFMSRFRNK